VTTDNARGNVTEFKLGNGAKTIRTHDALTGRVTQIWTTPNPSAADSEPPA
jgi:hypothetical protein